ncbi:MAG TPA: hypothetical protein VFZ48_03415 [Candidatus Saccharimonadales bacterium]
MALKPVHEGMLRAALEAAATGEKIPVEDKDGLRVHAQGTEVWVRFTEAEIDPVLQGEVLAYLEKANGNLRTQGRMLILNCDSQK